MSNGCYSLYLTSYQLCMWVIHSVNCFSLDTMILDNDNTDVRWNAVEIINYSFTVHQSWKCMIITICFL